MALTTLNLSGIKAGDSLNISVSQGGLTAGPYSVGSWGGGGAGGTITVSAVHRSYRQLAPDSVRFQVDLSSSSFDTAGPVGDEVYDARLHDLIYIWDMGDTGTWTAPVNVLTEWKNRNVAYGPEVMHMYRDPDDYTVSVLVIEPSSGKTATASTTITVGDPQDFYGDSNTIYVNNVGDSDFSYVPAGVPSGNKINVDQIKKYHNGSTTVKDATWDAFDGGHAKRWRFKRGGSWDMELYLTFDDTPDILFDDYGDPGEADPIWTIAANPGGSILTMIRAGIAHDQNTGRSPTASPPDLRCRNISFQANFNPVTTHANDRNREAATFLWTVGAMQIMMCDCTVNGFGGSIIVGQFGTGSSYVNLGKIHMDNCIVTNFGGEYQTTFWNSDQAGSQYALTGCRFSQPGDSVSTGAGTSPDGDSYGVGSRSIGRIASANFVNLRGCDFHIMDQDLGHFQFGKNSQRDGYLWNVHSCSGEMGSHFIGTDGGYSTTPQQRGHVHNIIIDGCIYAGGWNAKCMIDLKSTGLTLRNCIMYDSGTPRTANGVLGIVMISAANASGSPLPDYVADAPVRVHNCTLYMEREALENSLAGNWRPDIYDNSWADLTAVTEYNNIMHMPNYSIDGDATAPYIIYAPITENVLWAPRTLGYKDPNNMTLNTTYAFPADTFKDAKPGTGSSALNGAASNDRAFLDVTTGRRLGAGVNTIGTIDRGAWQVS